MDVAPLHQQPTTNDEELARVLAGANNEAPADTPAAGLQFEETSAPGAATPAPADTPEPPVATAEPVAPAESVVPAPNPAVSTPLSVAPGLEGLKKSALEELRPLVGRLNLVPEEKFDTLLLIIRSTDDQSLLEPAHEAAKQIPDEAKRAQALLDIIKEIDYFSQPGQPAL